MYMYGCSVLFILLHRKEKTVVDVCSWLPKTHNFVRHDFYRLLCLSVRSPVRYHSSLGVYYVELKQKANHASGVTDGRTDGHALKVCG